MNFTYYKIPVANGVMMKSRELVLSDDILNPLLVI
jgi:hypothetical protein